MLYTYPFPRPAVTCDCVVFTMRADDLAVLLVRRKEEPFRGLWALPGGFVNENERLERAAARELAEETGITGVKLEQIGAFGDPGRDPRGHTITIAYMTFLVAEAAITAGDDAAAVEWHAFRALDLEGALSDGGKRASRRLRTKTAEEPPHRTTSTTRRARTAPPIRLAFDHATIVARAYRRLCEHLDNPLRERSLDLLPSRFTLAELHRFYEVVLGRKISQRSFRAKLFDYEVVVPASAAPTRRPAQQLYRWNRG